ncbi:nucleoside-diphosphate sugar epimerase/dehydratase [Sphingomonas sp.]|uniref:polysaccharide biosynthesis protein n=1 Tax=Sphingomonas sp. TaxID=28214 RepID=UPI0017C27261|nr:nucleoside-diphosphate sugar epimerase/dehydratase [Sphingomonas sp.]MBA3511179.1 polysaccharide biosynthesis protein [Sphingomonas sp.]
MNPVLKFIRRTAELPRGARAALVALIDIVLCTAAALFAFWLRLGEWYLFDEPVLIFLAIAIPTWLTIAISTKTYRSLVRFSGAETIRQLAIRCGLMSLVLAVILVPLRVQGIPRTLAVLHPLVFMLALAGSRLGLSSLLLQALYSGPLRQKRKRVLIYGAGSAGQQLANSVREDPQIRVIGFVDENPFLSNRSVEGKSIWHTDELERILALEDVDEVFLALSTASRSTRRQIVERLRVSAPTVRVRMLPSISEIAFEQVSINDLRDVQIEELLGRDEVAPDPDLMVRNIAGKCVMVTGAGGSIGSELCRQIIIQQPQTLVLIERSEHALYLIDAELRELKEREGLNVQTVPELADVALPAECTRAFEMWRPDTVFHAAAYKHVPLIEGNPLQGIRNNVFGTLNVCLAAEAVGTGTFILVSTDKAVRPTSVMGASKRICELIIQARAKAQPAMTYSGVRFGNVLGSSGSVVPLFRRQIEKGGPVTVTHADVTRYFMTIPEASQLVIQAGALAEDGDIFLLDMGDPVRVRDLARSMIELSGLSVRDESNPDGDIEITEIGLRPGEKLYEELLIQEGGHPTSHPRIVRARESMIDWLHLQQRLQKLGEAIDQGHEDNAMNLLRLLVPGYPGMPEERVTPPIDPPLERNVSMN